MEVVARVAAESNRGNTSKAKKRKAREKYTITHFKIIIRYGEFRIVMMKSLGGGLYNDKLRLGIGARDQ
jgi:hypothetical protein